MIEEKCEDLDSDFSFKLKAPNSFLWIIFSGLEFLNKLSDGICTSCVQVGEHN